MQNIFYLIKRIRHCEWNEAIQIDWITSGVALVMTIKNNFAILNLVKSFLTSITLDNLSRKNLKNPCSVINKKLFLEEDFKMKSKQIISICLSFIILFAISCGEAAYAPADGYSTPTTTGDAATDLTDGDYSGTLTLSKTESSGGVDTSEVSTTFPWNVSISGNKQVKPKNAQIYKSGSEYSAMQELLSEDGSSKTIHYNKFTISGDTLNPCELVLIVEAGSAGYKLTYTGTLTKDTSSGASS